MDMKSQCTLCKYENTINQNTSKYLSFTTSTPIYLYNTSLYSIDYNDPNFYVIVLTTKAKKIELVYFVKAIYSNILLIIIIIIKILMNNKAIIIKSVHNHDDLKIIRI